MCNSCNRYLNSRSCFDAHIINGLCSSSTRCRECSVFYRAGAEHRCGHRLCKICQQQVTGIHYCYIRQKNPKAISAKYMFADFETDPTGPVHKPNLLVAHWQCEYCEGTSYRTNPLCTHCGSPCRACHGEVARQRRGHELRNVCMGSEDCGRRGIDFFGDNVVDEFCRFFLDRAFEGYTLIFHNGQAYDLSLIHI